MRKGLGGKVFDCLNIVGMLLLAAVMLYPYLNQIAISFNEGMDTAFGGITIFPRRFTLENYRAIFNNDMIINATFVTVITVIAATLLGLVICLSAAYALQKKGMPMRNFLIWFLLIPMYITPGLIPILILYRYLGLLNNIFVYILPGAFSFFNTLIIRSYLKGLPKGLEEAALIDGANEITVLFRVIVPLCMPVLATVALWLSVGAWNDWTTTLYFVNDRNLFRLQFVIMQIIQQSEIVQRMAAEAAMTGTAPLEARPTSETVKAAAIIFSTIPIIMVYPFLQRYFVKGVTIGAIKE